MGDLVTAKPRGAAVLLLSNMLRLSVSRAIHTRGRFTAATTERPVFAAACYTFAYVLAGRRHDIMVWFVTTGRHLNDNHRLITPACERLSPSLLTLICNQPSQRPSRWTRVADHFFARCRTAFGARTVVRCAGAITALADTIPRISHCDARRWHLNATFAI